jgi:DtxR family transcriptional regulator, Mn-dependent transcriptional regulator
MDESKFMSYKITARAKEYLLTINKITDQKGFAKTGDIASELDINPASVVEMLNRLQDLNLVIHKKYGAVKLTNKGLSIAKAIKTRHDIFRKFLEIILVPQEVAIMDASVLEHKLDYKTILQFTKFVNFMTLERPGVIQRWMKSFEGYCNKESSFKDTKPESIGVNH